MYNIKSLLTEELILNDKKNQLSEHTLMMISDPMYVKYILGIDVPLNEYYSLALRKKIIEEALTMQGVLTSANKFLGSAIEKGKEYTVNVINTVKSTKDIVMLFRDLILSPENMVKANKALNNICHKLVSDAENVITFLTSKLPNIANFTDKMVEMLKHVKQTVTNEINGEGWLGFLSKLGICILLTYIKMNFFDKIIQAGIQFIGDGLALFNGISSILNMFSNFKGTIIKSLDIQDIVSWIVNIGKTAVTQNLTIAFDILAAVTLVCSAVLAAINFKIDINKRQ